MAGELSVYGCDDENIITTFLALRTRYHSPIIQSRTETTILWQIQHICFNKLIFYFCFEAELAEQNLSDRTKLLEMRENSTSLKLQQQTVLLQQELNKMSNRGKWYKPL
jgi:hypothetical protein